MCEWRPEEHPGRSPGRGGKREKEEAQKEERKLQYIVWSPNQQTRENFKRRVCAWMCVLVCGGVWWCVCSV